MCVYLSYLNGVDMTQKNGVDMHQEAWNLSLLPRFNERERL